MRQIHQLVHSRTRRNANYALFPLEGYPVSHLPTWPTAEVRVLASPRIGAEFVQYLIDLPAGETGEFPARRDGIETFVYVLSGEAKSPVDWRAGSFQLFSPAEPIRVTATTATRLLVLRKRYEATQDHRECRGVAGHESAVTKNVWADDPGSLLQTLIPDDFAFDLAMNIFTFSPGHGLPIVETHVMEHGALILQGKGLYYLDGEWIEVEKDDFLWMGPYCPQSFYATGTEPAKYIYYKNVNREISL